MSEHEQRPEQLKAIEAALAALAPVACAVDRDRLMYLAGQASIASAKGPAARRWLWLLGMAASVLAAGTLGLVAGASREPRVVERIVRVPATAAPVAASAPRSELENRTPTYLRDLDRLLAGETMSPPAANGTAIDETSAPSTYLELRRRTLELF